APARREQGMPLTDLGAQHLVAKLDGGTLEAFRANVERLVAVRVEHEAALIRMSIDRLAALDCRDPHVIVRGARRGAGADEGACNRDEHRRRRAHHTFNRGSSVSRSQSPRRLTASTVSMIANPGNVANHQAVAM